MEETLNSFVGLWNAHCIHEYTDTCRNPIERLALFKLKVCQISSPGEVPHKSSVFLLSAMCNRWDGSFAMSCSCMFVYEGESVRMTVEGLRASCALRSAPAPRRDLRWGQSLINGHFIRRVHCNSYGITVMRVTQLDATSALHLLSSSSSDAPIALWTAFVKSVSS